jgi:hypothetical protein
MDHFEGPVVGYLQGGRLIQIVGAREPGLSTPLNEWARGRGGPRTREGVVCDETSL